MNQRRSVPEAGLRVAYRTVVVAAATLVAMVPAPSFSAAAPASEVDAIDVAARAALATLSPSDRAAQLVTTSVPGTSLAPADARVLAAARFGGVIIFGENYTSRAQLGRFTRSVQAAARAGAPAQPGVLVSVDQEGGVVRRLADAPPFRSHPQLGTADREASTQAQGRATAQVLRAAGVQLDLAPVADLDLRPRRVMAARSFGSDPKRVARHVVAFVAGLREGRVAASVKHFPGFGGASVNSDDALATITRSRAQINATDLEPFRAAIAGGADSVMVSHARYLGIDRLRPASASPAIYRMLREQLGYGGVAITDSLHAAGFTAATRTTVAQGCVRVVAAGADIALLTGSLADAVACRAALVAGVRAGTIPQARIDEAALRVLRLKAKLGLLPAAAQPAASATGGATG